MKQLSRPSTSRSLVSLPSSSRGSAVSRNIRVHNSFLKDILKPIVSSGKKLPLNEGIANFYDESTALWEGIWGEHLHHGLYPPGQKVTDHRKAQVDMIDEVLKWAGVSASSGVKTMVDVGCGVGGSSRHISRLTGCSAKGITLSPYQAKRAGELSQEQGLADKCSFQVADALKQPFADNSFDLVWSLESGEHMPDKRKFVGELARVCAPGGRVIIVTWCHRVLQPGEAALKPEEQDLLQRICDAYYLPAWCSVADYEKLFKENGLKNIKTDDWSELVAPFWGAVIETALTPEGISGLFKAGWTTIKGSLVMPLMAEGLKTGLIKFNLITATKN